MESDRQYRKLFSTLAMTKDPFKQGTNICCQLHTTANRYRQSLKAVESYELGYVDGTDINHHIERLDDSFKCILLLGYALARNYAQVYTLEADC